MMSMILMKTMVICKRTGCPYQDQETRQCLRRQVVITEYGTCAFMFNKTQERQTHTEPNWGYIKNEAAVFDAKISQINSEDRISQDAATEVKENEKEDGN